MTIIEFVSANPGWTAVYLLIAACAVGDIAARVCRK